MRQNDFVKRTVKFLKEADDISKLVTGKRLKDIFANTVAILTPQPAEDPNDPYNVLCIRQSASNKVIQMAFRAAAFEYHPDTGVRPDPVKFQKAVEAYENIRQERKIT